MLHYIRRLQPTVYYLGLQGALKFLLERLIQILRGRVNKSTLGSVNTYNVRNIEYPIFCRSSTSDRLVLRQIFIENEYSCLNTVSHVHTVLDCGANVGYSSAYFLSHHPSCRVIAVEPESGNFAMLQKNLAPYGDRATPLQAGIWSHPTGLTVSRGVFRDGLEWSTQVRESAPGETPEINALDIGSLVTQSGAECIDILKIDIEGTERIVFSSDCSAWLGKVRCIVIEIHDDQSREAFLTSVAPYAPTISCSGELTICQFNSL